METAQRVALADLRIADIFTGLTDDILDEISRFCVQRTYRAGEYPAIQGKHTDQLIIVNGGRVAVEMWVEVPRHSFTATVAALTKGRVCAWSALVPPYVLTASVKCLENTPMITIKDSDLQRIFAAKPVVEAMVMKNLAGIISSRLRDSNTQIARLCAEVIKEGIKHKE
jgi:hypothetical protein